MTAIMLDGHHLDRSQVVAVARDGAAVELAADALARVEAAAAFLDELLVQGEPLYGITTGFGSNAERLLSQNRQRPESLSGALPDETLVAELQRKLIESHAVCVGEPLEVREAGSHVDYVVDQTRASLAGLSVEELAKTVVAYEPVWAIGTGKVASAADAQEVCAAIRGLLRELTDGQTAEAIRILYGGSVKTGTIAEIVEQPDVDGGLVGGASLDGEEFARLVAAAAGPVDY